MSFENKYLVVRRARPKASLSIDPLSVETVAPAPMAPPGGPFTFDVDGAETPDVMADSPAPSPFPALRPATTVSVEVASTPPDDDDAEATPMMPLSLVEPVEMTLTAAEEAVFPLTSTTPADTWGRTAVGADRTQLTGAGVTIAVLDAGIDMGHSAFAHLASKLEFKDFTGLGQSDGPKGHGTHCAGTIFGGSVDNIKIGIAPGIKKALVARVLGGNAGTDALLDAIDWALDNDADVISMSLGYDFIRYRDWLMGKPLNPPAKPPLKTLPDPAATSRALSAYRGNIRTFDAAMERIQARRAEGRDAVIVAATGNESDRPDYVIDKSSPASAFNVVPVGAIDNKRAIAPFSNTEPLFVAPGVNVVSAKVGGGLTRKHGTSMACPHVAGLAALYWEHLRKQNPGARIEARTVVSSLEMNALSTRGSLFLQTSNRDVGQGMPGAPDVNLLQPA